MPEVDSSIQVLGFRSKSKRPQQPIQISVSNPDWIGIRWPPGFPPKNLTSWLYLFVYIRTTNLKKGIKRCQLFDDAEVEDIVFLKLSRQ